MDLNLETDLKSGIHFLSNYLLKETFRRGLPFESFEILKNWFIDLNLLGFSAWKIQNNFWVFQRKTPPIKVSLCKYLCRKWIRLSRLFSEFKSTFDTFLTLCPTIPYIPWFRKATSLKDNNFACAVFHRVILKYNSAIIIRKAQKCTQRSHSFLTVFVPCVIPNKSSLTRDPSHGLLDRWTSHWLFRGAKNYGWGAGAWDPNHTPGVDFLGHNFLSSKNSG